MDNKFRKLKLKKEISPYLAGKHGINTYLYYNTEYFWNDSEVFDSFIKIENTRANILKNILKNILIKLNAENIEYFIVKGITLSNILFDDIRVRPGKDIDIFVRKKYLNGLISILESLGFENKLGKTVIEKLYKRFGVDLSFRKNVFGFDLNIDVHFSFEDYTGRNLDVYFKNIQQYEFYDVKVISLKEEFYLYFLIDHFIKHRMDYYKDMLDIYYILKKFPDLLKIKFCNIEKKIIKKCLYSIENGIEIHNLPEEGNIKDYLRSFLILSLKRKFLFIIKHFFIPFENEVLLFDLKENNIFFYLLLKPMRIILNLWKRLLKTILN